MPRFSVIVPAYQVQAYLPECLESVLAQSYDDLEVIVVDDRSPDACGEIAGEFAARDARVTAVRLAENHGLSGARNAGLEAATGDYVVFLDGDDTLAPDALRAIADRLKETGEPDVLAYGHAVVDWTGTAVPDTTALQPTEPAPFRLEDRPGLLHLPTPAWNKACRREFASRFAFAPGRHADLAWSYPVLLSARTVATLDRVCVRHRVRRGHRSPGSDFDVFEQYDRLFAFVGRRRELAAWRPVLYRRMLDHLAELLAVQRPRAEFLRRARAHHRGHRTPGRHPFRLGHTLIGLGMHRAYAARESAGHLGRRTRALAARLAGALRGAALRLHHRVQRFLPLQEDRAVFTTLHGNPGALEAAFRAHAPQVRTSRLAPPGTAARSTALARAKYLVTDGRLDHAPAKRPGQIHVQTQQGTPLGHMGLDLQERPAAARDLDFAALLADVDRWDYVLSPNRHTTLTWERVYPGGYTTLPYGNPRNDVFQRATSQDVRRLRESLGVPEGTVAILYAPAHRDYRRTQLPPLDLDRVLRRLGPRFVILARTPYPATHRVVDVSGHPSVEELCLASDALLTDYASLMFDYAGLDRPIVVHTEDWEAYDASRGTYFDLRAFPPGAVARGEDELVDIFTTGHWRGSRSTQLRAAFRERFCPYDDGRAAERVVRRVVLGESAPAPVVPVEERTPVPSAAEGPAASVPRPASPLTVIEQL
ncbi:CDP-glycerol glycerophosphotransferase family protein [Streptomyces sp. NPDC090106]|uniref:bifunctional glycosyltransferase/CDP-glycerol:glycerophosphate glycerophosphotransferase n=1 Tax=Streptomyces sp. NPDC090106 TaxID=3365946 RepID=UPI00382AAA21